MHWSANTYAAKTCFPKASFAIDNRVRESRLSVLEVMTVLSFAVPVISTPIFLITFPSLISTEIALLIYSSSKLAAGLCRHHCRR